LVAFWFSASLWITKKTCCGRLCYFFMEVSKPLVNRETLAFASSHDNNSHCCGRFHTFFYSHPLTFISVLQKFFLCFFCASSKAVGFFRLFCKIYSPFLLLFLPALLCLACWLPCHLLLCPVNCFFLSYILSADLRSCNHLLSHTILSPTKLWQVMPQIVIRTLLFEGFIGLLCFFLFLIHCILTVLIFSKRIARTILTTWIAAATEHKETDSF